MSHERSTLDELRIDRKSAPEKRSAPWIVLGLLVVLVLGGAVFFIVNRSQPLVVKTAVAREAAASGGKTTLLNASGYVTARREATVSSKITGKVIEVLVEEGMKVEEGQVLARLDAVNVQANLRLSEAQLAATRAALNETEVRVEEAERELRRVQQLSREQIAAATDLDRAQAGLDSLKARLQQQRAQVIVSERELAVWQQQLEDTIVRAPFAGIVTAKNAQPGEMISPMSAGGFTRTGICTIVDMASLEIEVDVNESYIGRVRAGQPVEATLDSYPDWKIPCKVIAIIPTADRQKATVQVRVGFDQLDPRILPHMGVKVAFKDGESGGALQSGRAIVIPKGALQQQDDQDFVWVFQNGRVERRAVKTAASLDDEVTLSAGVSGGEKVVIDPPAGLAEGVSVEEQP